jgi:hypothetical protein
MFNLLKRLTESLSFSPFMTTVNPLPPQAYTKDTLLKSYQWLLQQPAHIQEVAKTPDILVSLYLKAKLNGESSLERPSIQNFKNELKSLAGIMGDLESPVNSTYSSRPLMPPPAPPTSPSAPTVSAIAASANGKSDKIEIRNSAFLDLDPRSIETLNIIMSELNLSSQNEALRVALTFAAKKIKEL